VGIEFAPVSDDLHTWGVGLDTCRDKETGALEAWAQAVVARLATYSEVSPSGTGASAIF
jgi:putative DNA primase/helicase